MFNKKYNTTNYIVILNCKYHISFIQYIPRTQLTSIFEGKPLKTRGPNLGSRYIYTVYTLYSCALSPRKKIPAHHIHHLGADSRSDVLWRFGSRGLIKALGGDKVLQVLETGVNPGIGVDFTPKMDGENKGKTLFNFLMDDLGGQHPYFWKHPNWRKNLEMGCKLMIFFFRKDGLEIIFLNPMLEIDALPETNSKKALKMDRNPKGKERLPTSNFRGRAVGFREGSHLEKNGILFESRRFWGLFLFQFGPRKRLPNLFYSPNRRWFHFVI